MASSSLVLALTTLCILCSLQATVATTSPAICLGLSLEYYSHEMRSGPNKTVLLAAGTNQGGNFDNGTWGSIFVFDNIIKEKMSSDSKVLGRITGTTVLTANVKVNGPGPVQFMALHIFGEGSKYNGSTFTVIPGGNIPAGTGYFEGYKGYAKVVEKTVDVPAGEGLHIYLWTLCLSKL